MSPRPASPGRSYGAGTSRSRSTPRVLHSRSDQLPEPQLGHKLIVSAGLRPRPSGCVPVRTRRRSCGPSRNQGEYTCPNSSCFCSPRPPPSSRWPSNFSCTAGCRGHLDGRGRIGSDLREQPTWQALPSWRHGFAPLRLLRPRLSDLLPGRLARQDRRQPQDSPRLLPLVRIPWVGIQVESAAR